MSKKKGRVENLKVIDSKERARELQLKSAEARKRNNAERKNIKLAVEQLLEKTFTDKKGNKMSGAEAIAIKQFEKALKGDSRAFEIVRDTAGQKPVEKIQVDEVEKESIDELERMILDE